VQVSVDGGSTWIYDTATDTDLPNGGIQFSGLGRYLAWDIAPNAGPVTYDNLSLTLNGVSVTNPPSTNEVVLLRDSYDVAGSGSGFALGSGANSGINPQTTRLTGSAAANLFYLKAYGAKPDSCHYITNDDKLVVALSSVDYSTLSLSSGSGAYDFGPALEVSTATPDQPLIYDLTINLANATVAANQRCSFAISSTAGTANVWDFGIQIYRASAGDSSYVLQRRISTGASGLQNAINDSIGTVGTYPGEVPFLLRITDAGAESGTFSSRVQISVDGGASWIYDTATDPALPNGWRFSGLARYLFFDIAPGTGPVTYDNLSLVSHGLTYGVPPTNPPLVFTAYQLTAKGLELTWVSQKNTNYSVLMSTNLNASSWRLITNITAASLATTIAHPTDESAAFYQVAQLINSGISVSNVVAAQRNGTGLVDIDYDLADLYGDYASVSMLVSTNGGQTYDAGAASFSGDVGAGIPAGTARHIVWNAGADLAGISASDLRVEIVTDRSLVGSNMALIPAGAFDMGNSESPDGIACESPVHTVSVDAFYADRYAVTKGLWDVVYEWATNHGYSFDSPAVAPGPNFPVQQISWYDAVKWCNARSEKEGLPPAYFVDATWTQAYRTGQVDLAQTCVRWAGAGYRLPTEAEWEKAARGGLSGKRFPWGDTINELQANYWSTLFESYDVNGTSGPNLACPLFPNTVPVGSFPPTGYGLYDMVGNTWVWCWDYYGDSWYSDSLATRANPRGPASASWGGDRVYRGGSGVDNSWKCRVANRADAPPRFAMGHFGFRVVLPTGNDLSVASSSVFSLNP
ncbi:MAG TPA: SUMF1/EgtB/PvdO family nonheme iron enzyme, partial [Verrucomicrobiae bacterium]